MPSGPRLSGQVSDGALCAQWPAHFVHSVLSPVCDGATSARSPTHLGTWCQRTACWSTWYPVTCQFWALGASDLCDGAPGAQSPAHLGTECQQTVYWSTRCSVACTWCSVTCTCGYLVPANHVREHSVLSYMHTRVFGVSFPYDGEFVLRYTHPWDTTCRQYRGSRPLPLAPPKVGGKGGKENESGQGDKSRRKEKGGQ